jgi:proline racemase
VSAEADAGGLFMHNDGYSTACGHGPIAVTTIGLERKLLLPRREGEVVFDSPAGLIRARPHGVGPDRVSSVAFTNVPSFVYEAGVTVKLERRALGADIAFGGAFYAIVDAESAGVPIEASALPDLRRIGMQIARGVEAARAIVHPLDPGLCGISGTIFIGPAHAADADLRNVTIFADAAVDRSPCGTETGAVMAVLDAMSLLPSDRALVHESIIGTVLRGRITGRETIGGYDAIVPEIEGSAWITGEHVFLVDDEDPLRDGFRV